MSYIIGILLKEILTCILPSKDIHLILDLGGRMSIPGLRFFAMDGDPMPCHLLEVETVYVIEELLHLQVVGAAIPTEVDERILAAVESHGGTFTCFRYLPCRMVVIPLHRVCVQHEVVVEDSLRIKASVEYDL